MLMFLVVQSTAAVTRPTPTPEPVPLRELPGSGLVLDAVPSPSGTDDWEIDSSQLKFIRKVSTGSSGDM